MAEDISTRTQILIGKEGVDRLRNSSVILCGCGAVGGYAFEGLVRAGIGELGLADGARVDVTRTYYNSFKEFFGI